MSRTLSNSLNRSLCLLFCFSLVDWLAVPECAAQSQSARGPEIAALEQVRIETHGSSPTAYVRLLFARDRHGWTAFPHKARDQDELSALASSYEGRREWMKVDGDETPHRITSDLVEPLPHYSNVGLQQVLDPVGIRIAETEDDIGGPINPSLLIPYTPGRSVEDPDGWHAVEGAALTPLIKSIVLGRLAETDIAPLMERLTRQHIEERIHIAIEETYRSAGEGLLFKIKAAFSSGGEDYPKLLWFFQPPDATPRFLSPFNYSGPDMCMEIPEMRLLGIGDFDDDGDSEVIFTLGGYNYGGYRLFWEDFGESATFDWSYH